MSQFNLGQLTGKDLENIYLASVEAGEARTRVVNKNLSNQLIELHTLQCTDFIGSDLTNTVLKGCDLRGAAFDQAILFHTRLIDCCVGACSFPEQALVPGNEMIEFEACKWQVLGQT